MIDYLRLLGEWRKAVAELEREPTMYKIGVVYGLSIAIILNEHATKDEISSATETYRRLAARMRTNHNH